MTTQEEQDQCCKFHLTIPAEKLPGAEKYCLEISTKRIASVDNERLISLDFCEYHYNIMKKFLEEEEKK